MSCAICEVRKEKRFCPGVHGRICPTCCGTEREVTVECPSDCPYLQQARAYEKPRSLDQVVQSALFPRVEIPEKFLYENEHLLVGLEYALARAACADRSVNDRDLIAAVASLAKTYDTLVNSGLVYEAPTANVVHQAIAAEIQNMLSEYRELEQKQVGYSMLKDSDVLRALVFLLRMAESHTSGRPKSRAYIDLLCAQFPDDSALSRRKRAVRASSFRKPHGFFARVGTTWLQPDTTRAVRSKSTGPSFLFDAPSTIAWRRASLRP